MISADVLITMSQLQGFRFDLKPRLLSEWRFGCSPCTHMDFFRVLWCPPTSQKHACRWISISKLPLGMHQFV